MNHFFLYSRLTCLDVARLWSTVQHHVIIVAGICLPILLLLGLKNGHVAELRKDLLQSPTGRQVVFWAGQSGKLMDMSVIQEYKRTFPQADVFIPEIQRSVSLRTAGTGASGRSVGSVTLYSTVPGDPILGQMNLDIQKSGEKTHTDIVVSQSVVDKLKVKVGDTVTATVARSNKSGLEETGELPLRVMGIIPDGDEQSSYTGFASVELLLEMEAFVQGDAVARYKWPAMNNPVGDTYSGYLIFCEKPNVLSEADIETLKDKNLTAFIVDDPEVQTLYGLLKPESVDKLQAYFVTVQSNVSSYSKAAAWGNMSLAPSQLARWTDADDVVIPWNKPINHSFGGVETQVVGLCLPKITWLKLYLKDKEHSFNIFDEADSILFPQAGPSEELVSFTLDKTLSFHLKQKFVTPQPTAPLEADEGSRSGSDADEKSDSDGEAAAGLNPESSDPFLSLDSKIDIQNVRACFNGKAGPSDPGYDSSRVEMFPFELSTPNASFDLASSNPEEPLPETQTPPKKGESDKGLAGKADDTIQANAASSPPIAVVPAEMLARIYSWQSGNAVYDPLSKQFVRKPTLPLFDKVRLYAKTIDNVPEIVSQLRERNYVVMSEITRISEIHQQDKSLMILVLIVAVGVFAFGVITVISILVDSTERKRGAIGIMRVMGVSRRGIFYLIFLRSSIIAALAVCVTFLFGWLLKLLLVWDVPSNLTFLSWKPVINISYTPLDFLLVALGALLCCSVGSLIPARKASRLDPFDAIVEGRFR